MKKTSLYLSIPKPCMENYAAMDKKEGGRLCNKCNNIIYDFSQMTNGELLQYFKKNPVTHCGRFHHSQLNKPIEAINIKYSFANKISKIAASVLALITLKFSTVKAGNVNHQQINWQQNKNKYISPNLSDSIFISGVIINDKKEVLKNVTITFNGKQVAITDEIGYYSFKIAEAIETNLYFNCNGYNTNVRNYSPAMGNAIYNVILNEHGEESYGSKMGVISLPTYLNDALPSIHFANSKTLKLSKTSKSMLDLVSSKLKSNPDATILLQGHTSQATAILVNKRISAIKRYLSESKGISIDRINTSEDLFTYSNVIDIKFEN